MAASLWIVVATFLFTVAAEAAVTPAEVQLLAELGHDHGGQLQILDIYSVDDGENLAQELGNRGIPVTLLNAGRGCLNLTGRFKETRRVGSGPFSESWQFG